MTDYREICAALADAVYGDQTAQGGDNHENNIPQYWTQIELDGNPETEHDYRTAYNGFAAAAYINGDEVVISYRGTDDWADRLTNYIAMGKDILPDQFSDALEFYFEIKDMLITNPNAKITITGHSLGGALAQLVGAAIEDLNATGYTDTQYQSAYSFNGPGVSHLAA